MNKIIHSSLNYRKFLFLKKLTIIKKVRKSLKYQFKFSLTILNSKKKINKIEEYYIL